MGPKNTYAKHLQKRQGQLNRTAMQIMLDAAVIAANAVLGLGPGRAKEFCERTVAVSTEMLMLIGTDGKDDRDIEYARHVIDTRIAQIVGDNFQPWDERYS